MDGENIFSKLKNRVPEILGHEQFRKSAVLLPLLDVKGETHVLFEVRSMKMRSQPGDICFPGGRMDEKDADPSACAIRETVEELGIHAEAIEDVFPLDYVVNDLGRIIYPFAGRIENIKEIVPNEAEVEEVFTVPLSFFMDTKPDLYRVNLQAIPAEDFPFDLIVGGKDYNWRTRHINELFYVYEGKVIWGLTAKIMQHFTELLKNKE